jgi:hypothetical protein
MTVFYGALVFAYCSFQPGKAPENKHIVGIHLMRTTSIGKRLWISTDLGSFRTNNPRRA